jgi:centromere protein V
MNELITHKGGCHCGRVRFEVDAPAELVIDECNCSMCTRTAFLHLIVTAERFRITLGADSLTNYTFNTGTAKHLFCAICGIKPFYVPRSHPDGWSVNARCIDAGTVTAMKINAVDGRNWEKHYPAGRGEFKA